MSLQQNWAYDGGFDFDLGLGPPSRGSPMRGDTGFAGRSEMARTMNGGRYRRGRPALWTAKGLRVSPTAGIAFSAPTLDATGSPDLGRSAMGNPPLTLQDSPQLQPEYESALKLYADRFYPMFPVLKDRRLRADLQDGRLIHSPTFATLIESIMVLQEATEMIESAARPDGTPAGEASTQPVAPKLAALTSQSPRFDNVGVDTVMVALHLFVALEMHGDKAA